MPNCYIRTCSINDAYPQLEELRKYSNTIFMEPWICDAWTKSFGKAYRNFALIGYDDNQPIGYMPIKIDDQERKASFCGDKEVFDFSDFVTLPGYEESFFKAAVRHLKETEGVDVFSLETLRPDSNVYQYQSLFPENKLEQYDVSYEMELPKTFEEYLESLGNSEKSEIERKMRNLSELGVAEFEVLKDQEINDVDIDIFIKMMVESRKDKAQFMTLNMERYFKNLIHAAQNLGIVRMGFLRIGQARVASVLCFIWQNGLHLYNSGYDPDYVKYSVGLLSKVFAVRYAIEQKMCLYDFLKGSESYKARLGGRIVDLYRMTF